MTHQRVDLCDEVVTAKYVTSSQGLCSHLEIN